MLVDVQFEENQDLEPLYRRNKNAGQSKMVGFVMRTFGLKNPQTANVFLIAAAIIFFAFSIYLFFGGNEKPKARGIPQPVEIRAPQSP